jgi:hypothetical protein
MRATSGLVLGVCLLLTGCGGVPGDAPETVPVVGKVLRKGDPFADVSVVFQQLDMPEGQAVTSTGFTDEQGRYELMVNRNTAGAPPGKYKVSLIGDDGLDDIDPRKKAPGEVVIPSGLASFEFVVPPEGLEGGAADFDLEF